MCLRVLLSEPNNNPAGWRNTPATVCQKMAQAVGWQPGRPCRPHAPKLGEQREKAMNTSRGGSHLFTSSDEDSEEDEPEGRSVGNLVVFTWGCHNF